MNESDLLHELTPVAESLLERHLATSKEWFPHDYVPYSRGRDHVKGHEWTPDDADLAGHEIGRRGAQCAPREPAHRGQPAVLLPHRRADVRQGRRLGHVGQTVDGRGRSPLHGDLRVPDDHPGDRPGGTRAFADGAGVGRADTRSAAVRGPHLPGTPGVGDAHLAPQHRGTARRSGRLRSDEACRQRREPAPTLLSRPRRGGDRDRSEHDDDRHGEAGAQLRDARHRDSRLRPPRRTDREGRHLRPAGAPRADPRAGGHPSVGRRERRRSLAATARSPRRS